MTAPDDLLTRRLALRFRWQQSLHLARVEGAAAALERMGLPDIAAGLRLTGEQAEAASEALLARVDPSPEFQGTAPG